MQKIKVLIVEDKSLIAESIAATLRKNSLEVVGMCDTGEEAILLTDNVQPDLILMDIELAGALDGIATAKIILDKFFLPIIYLSDYTDKKTVDRAKKTFPANYLAKPFQEPDLIRAIDIAFYNANTKSTSSSQMVLDGYAFLRTDNQVYIKLAYDNILYLAADRAYCNVVTMDKTYKMSTSMNHIQEQLNSKIFFKIHRSHVVNVNKISAIDGNMVHLGKHILQMSKELKEELMDKLNFIK